MGTWQHGWAEAWDSSAETAGGWESACFHDGNVAASNGSPDRGRRNMWAAQGSESHARWQRAPAWEHDSWDQDAWQGWGSAWSWDMPHETDSEVDVDLPNRAGVDARQPLGVADSDATCQVWEDAKATDVLSAPTSKAMFTATVLRPGGFDALVTAGHSPFELWRRLPDAEPEPWIIGVPAVPLKEDVSASTQACNQTLTTVAHSAEPLQAWITSDVAHSCQPEVPDAIKPWPSAV